MNVNPQFKLLKPSADKPTAIRLFLYFDKKRFVYGTGEKINPKLWDNVNQRPTQDKAAIRKAKAQNPSIAIYLNNLRTTLDNFANEVKRSFTLWESQGIVPSKDRLKTHLDEIFKDGARKSGPLSLNQYIDTFIKQLESGERTTENGKRYAHGTIKNYNGFKTQLTNYQTEKRVKLDFEHITTDFYDSFVKFFNDKSYSQNTIGRHIKNLKTIMRASLDEGLHKNREFERRKFKTIRVDTPSIYLTKDELNRIAALDLSNSKSMELARDVFLVGCYTAQRYSDYSRIRPEHIKTTGEGTKVINLVQKKTGERVIIPLSPELEAILKKYNYSLPKTYEQKVNSSLKDIGALAKINTPELVETIKGGKKVIKSIPKCQLIKTHTARRTGATHLFLNKFSPIDIMKITGHSSTKNLLKYIRVTKEETADRLAKHEYFSSSKTGLKAV